MFKTNISVYSTQLKNILEFKSNKNVILHQAFSRISSLYNLTLNNNNQARYALFKTLNDLDKLNISIRDELHTYQS
jgi:hypothetical protein